MGRATGGKRKLNGLSYGRVSTINQMLDSSGSVREDASPVAQKIRCQDHAKYLSQKSGLEYKLVEHISDEGFSAKNVNRPGYQKMWKLVASGSVDFIIASELSRLSRSVADFLDLVSHCQNHEVDLIIIGLDLDTSTPFGRVIVVILVALAQFEREMTSMRVRENALTRLLNDGKINGGGEILGLDRDSKVAGHFVRNNEELVRVETLFRLFLEVNSKAKLIEEASRRGLRGKRGQPLTMHSITIMLENARWRYRGLWPANRENKERDQELLPENRRYREVELPHGPLLDEALLNQVVEKLQDNYDHRKRSGADNFIYLLSGVLVSEDGSKFGGQPGKDRQYRYYYNKERKLRLACNVIDKLIRDKVKEHLGSHEQYQKIIKDGFTKLQGMIPEIDARISQLDKALSEITRDEKKLLQHFSAAQLDDPTYSAWLKRQLQETSNERSRIEGELGSLQERKQAFLSQRGLVSLRDGIKTYLDDGFERLAPAMQRSIVEKIVPAVVVKDNNQVEIHIATPFRDFVTYEEKSTDYQEDGGRDGT